MQASRIFLIVLATSLVIAPVCVANNASLARAKTFSSDSASRLKRAVWRSSITEKICAGVAAILLTTSAYGDGMVGDNGIPRAAGEEVASQAKRYDLLSLYFGTGRNYMAESTGAYTTKIEGVEYERLGDYYGLPTTIAETTDSYVGGLGAHLGDTGVEVKFFFFGGVDRVKSGEFFPSPHDDRVVRATGNMPNIIFAGTRQLFGINAKKGFVGLGEKALLTLHLGPSFNIHPVTGTITSHRPSLTTRYEVEDAAGNIESWEEKEDSQRVVDLPVGVGGHLGLGLLWQVNLDLKSFNDDDVGGDLTGMGLGLSYVGSVTYKGSHTHLLMLRLSLRGEE